MWLVNLINIPLFRPQTLTSTSPTFFIVELAACAMASLPLLQFALLAVSASICSSKTPNIVLLLTDDQDLLLGGMTPMPFTRNFMESRGSRLTNFFVNTPVCCPSRTTLLSGNYPHNWHTTSEVNQCMHMSVNNSAFQASVFTHNLKALGYTTGQFGKLLNPPGMWPYCVGSPLQPLPGFDHWISMCNDNTYFNNIFAMDGVIFESGTEPEDYLTSIIGNGTIKFVTKALEDDKPFFVYVSPHAPHVPATPAPWYADRFSGPSYKAPRTKNYNFSALDHHYVIRSQPPITSTQAPEVDELFQNRWRSLLSVDDIMIELVTLLQQRDELDNTYFIWTSDHGFQLGQFRLPSCKLQPYEHDIRVPFFVAGPGIPGQRNLSIVTGMVDVAPTIIGLAGGKPPSTHDGKSFADLLKSPEPHPKDATWRDVHTLEYWTLGNVIRYDHYIDMPNDTYIGARLINATHNYLYAEFYQGDVAVFNNTLEYELFDLSTDPYQLKNIYGTQKALEKELHDFLQKQVTCKGKQCT